MGQRIIHMLRKEFIRILRDPRMKFILFVAPMVQLLVFGYAATTDVKDIATAVLDRDNSVASRELVGRFVHSGYFDVSWRLGDDERVRRLLDRGAVRAVLVINHGFGEDLAAGKTAQLQVVLDGTDSTTARVVMDYGTRIAGQFSDSVLTARLERFGAAAAAPGQVNLQDRSWFNDNLESRNYYVPGVIAMIVMLVTLLLTSMAVVREREIGTMEQIMVTPITPTEFIPGKTVPFALIGFINVIVATLAGRHEIPQDPGVRGNAFQEFFLPANRLARGDQEPSPWFWAIPERDQLARHLGLVGEQWPCKCRERTGRGLRPEPPEFAACADPGRVIGRPSDQGRTFLLWQDRTFLLWYDRRHGGRWRETGVSI